MRPRGGARARNFGRSEPVVLDVPHDDQRGEELCNVTHQAASAGLGDAVAEAGTVLELQKLAETKRRRRRWR